MPTAATGGGRYTRRTTTVARTPKRIYHSPVSAMTHRSSCVAIASPFVFGGVFLLGTFTGGCGDSLFTIPAPLFGVELTIDGNPVGPAIIDTGGGYEVMLRNPFNLRTIGSAEVLVFGGREVVDVTEAFDYSAGGWEARAEGAIVDLSICDCNGLGFFFFRRTGAVLEVDFATLGTAFLARVPDGGVTIPFERPPDHLRGFDAAFVEVELTAGGTSQTLLGLLDTGTNVTLIQRTLVANVPATSTVLLDATVTERHLGTVAIRLGLFDSPGLPDIILGTDIMRAWADRWYFEYDAEGGRTTAFDLAAVQRGESGPVAARPSTPSSSSMGGLQSAAE